MRLKLLLAAGLLASPTHLIAQQETSPPTESAANKLLEQADYSEVMDKMLQFAYPRLNLKTLNANDVVYGKAAAVKKNNNHYFNNGSNLKKLSGNAWIINEKNGIILDFKNVQEWGHSGSLIGNEKYLFDQVEIKKDLKTITRNLKKTEDIENMLRGYYANSTEVFAHYFLMAAFSRHLGYEKESQTIVAKLVDLIGSQELLDIVVSMIANNKYKEIYADFNKNKDWVIYANKLDQLVKKYARGWDTRDAHALLAQKIRHRSENLKPVFTELKGVEIDEALRDDIIKHLSSRHLDYMQNLWVYQAKTPSIQNKKIARLFKDKKKTMLVLISLLDCDFMMEPDKKSKDDFDEYSNYSSFSSDDSIEEQYEALDKPLTISSKVKSIVVSGYPFLFDDSSFNSNDEFSNKDIQNIALQQWKKDQTLSKEETYLAVMKSIDGSDTHSLITTANSFNDEASYKIAEEKILANMDSLSQLYNIQNYVDNRGEKANAFSKNFVSIIRKQIPNKESFNNYDFGARSYADLDKQLKKISRASHKVDHVGDLTSLIDTPMSDQEFADKLEIMAGDYKTLAQFTENRQLMLETIQKLSDDRRQSLADMMTSIYFQLGFNFDYHTNKDNKLKMPKHSDKEIEILRVLLKDNTPVKKDHDFYGYVSDLAGAIAVYLEYTDGTTKSNNIHNIQKSLGVEIFSELIVKRAIARLDGTDIPEFPSADSVSQERMQAITTKISTLKGKEISAYTESLSPSEKMAWTNKLASQKDIPQSVLDLELSIVRLNLTNITDKQTKENIQTFFNKHVNYEALNTDTLNKIIDHMYQKPELFHGYDTYFYKNDQGIGLQMFLRLSNNYTVEGLKDAFPDKKGSIVFANLTSQEEKEKVYLFSNEEKPEEWKTLLESLPKKSEELAQFYIWLTLVNMDQDEAKVEQPKAKLGAAQGTLTGAILGGTAGYTDGETTKVELEEEPEGNETSTAPTIQKIELTEEERYQATKSIMESDLSEKEKQLILETLKNQ